ncbi:MAG TPA: hypothetical protein VMM76_12870 [Pirellulaceae bacterium]|nr:hypothetical protein [Pirellulaceae bacterium]
MQEEKYRESRERDKAIIDEAKRIYESWKKLELTLEIIEVDGGPQIRVGTPGVWREPFPWEDDGNSRGGFLELMEYVRNRATNDLVRQGQEELQRRRELNGLQKTFRDYLIQQAANEAEEEFMNRYGPSGASSPSGGTTSGPSGPNSPSGPSGPTVGPSGPK